MNGHAKRARDVVVALGFTYDHDASTYGKCVYRHPASPNEPVKLWGGMAEQASRAVIDKARRIAGLSPVGARGGESAASGHASVSRVSGREKPNATPARSASAPPTRRQPTSGRSGWPPLGRSPSATAPGTTSRH